MACWSSAISSMARVTPRSVSICSLNWPSTAARLGSAQITSSPPAAAGPRATRWRDRHHRTPRGERQGDPGHHAPVTVECASGNSSHDCWARTVSKNFQTLEEPDANSQEFADALSSGPCVRDWPTSPPRPASARQRCPGSSTTSPACAAETRQAVLTALDVLGYERPARLRASAARAWSGWSCRSWRTRSSRCSPRSSSRCWPSTGTRRCCAPRPRAASPRTSTSRCCSSARSPASSSSPACTPTPPPTPSATAGWSPGDCRSCWSTATSRASTRPSSRRDDAAAAELAVAHLVSLGHRRIGLISGPERFLPVQRKLDGLRRAMTELLGADRRELDELVVAVAVRRRGRRGRRRPPARPGRHRHRLRLDLMALGAIRAARQRGLSVPRDVSVVGYDDSPLIAFTDPPLTTVRQPVQAMASAAVRALLDEIRAARAPLRVRVPPRAGRARPPPTTAPSARSPRQRTPPHSR